MRRAGLYALASMFLLVSVALAELAADAAKDVTAPDGLSGRDIYERVIEHRLQSFSMSAVLVSGDQSGHEQESKFRVRWKDFRNEDGSPTRGILSKTVVEFTAPYDFRFAGYMVQVNEDRPSDQFVYVSVQRRIFRINLRGVPVHGTDFSFDDVIPPEAVNFSYRRVADEVYEGIPVHVVELYPRRDAESSHSKILVSVDKERYLVVRARYWDMAGAETKELVMPAASIKQFGKSWFPMRGTMRNLLTGSYTTLKIDKFEANPEFDDAAFDVGKLESH